MSSHSQFKKFNILQELEQAIKKKTQEKYLPNRSKSRTKYHIFYPDHPKTSNMVRSNHPPTIEVDTDMVARSRPLLPKIARYHNSSKDP